MSQSTGPNWGATPAGPRGLQQQYQRAAEQPQTVEGPYWGKSRPMADPWAAQITSTRNSPRWTSGGQWGSTENGYSTPFYQTFFQQQEEEAGRNNLQNLYARDDFTGIVTYNGVQDHSGRDVVAGDIYEDGRRVGNLYEQYSRADATQIMADLTLHPDVRADAYQRMANGDTEVLDRLVTQMIDDTTRDQAKFRSQNEYNVAVDEKTGELEGGPGFGLDEALTALGGAAGGALTMWWLGPWGWLAGAAGGATTALMNQDAILDQAARTMVQTEMAYQDFGLTGALPTAVAGWTGVGGRFLQPTTNLVQGSYDLLNGGTGDSRVAWYEGEDGGPAQRGGVWTTLGVLSTLTDSAMLFGSGPGLTAFQAQMTGQIGGATTQLIGTGGSTFSDQRGEFDNIFTNDDGQFDPGSAAAGIGSIVIDAVQLGTAKGLSNMFRSRASGPTPGSVQEAAGFGVTIDAAGTAQWLRGSMARSARLSLLAPSEALTAASARVMAQRASVLRGGERTVVTADDFYRAAMRLTDGTGRWPAALVTGFGEGYEEFAQAVLNPLSHNDKVDWQDAVDAALQGFSMGTGMYLGTSLRRYNGQRAIAADDRLYAQALLARQNILDLAKGEDAVLSREEWNEMTSEQRKAAAQMAPAQLDTYKKAYKRLMENQSATEVATIAGVDKKNDALLAEYNLQAKKSGSRTDGAYVISQIVDAKVPNNAVVSSFEQTMKLLQSQRDGIAEQLEDLKRTIAAGGDPAIEAEAQQDIGLATQRELYALMEFLKRFEGDIATAREAGDKKAMRQLVWRLNRTLRKNFDNGNTTDPAQALARQRATSLLFIRDPREQTGSFQLLMPQIDFALTMAEANDILYVSPAILQAIGGDFDGDKIAFQGKIALDDQAFINLRTGRNLVGVSKNARTGRTSVNIATRDNQKAEILLISEALRDTNSALNNNAVTTIATIVDKIEDRYQNYILPDVLDPILDRFKRNMRNGDLQAHADLLSDLVSQGGDGFWKHGIDTLANEPLWVDQVFHVALQSFQYSYNVHEATKNRQVNTSIVNPVRRTSREYAVRQKTAATLGQDLANRADGWSLFRMFQKLRYNVFNTAVERSRDEATTAGLQDLVEVYARLSQGMTRSELEQTGARDEVSQKVIAWLRRLATGPDAKATDITLLANMSVADLRVVDGELVHRPEPITLVQLLMRNAIVQERQEKAAAVTPELEARWSSLERLTRPGQSGAAFVATLGSLTMWELLGSAASSVGTHLTVEQFARLYMAQGKEARRQTSQLLRQDPSYGNRDGKHDLPYDFDEVSDGQISAFRSVMEAVLEYGNKRVFLHEYTEENKAKGIAGTAGGELGNRSNKYQEALVEAFTNIQLAFTELGINSRKASGVRKFLNLNPARARKIFDLIPNADANGVFQVVNGRLRVSRWFYAMLGMPPEQAAMHYWKHLTLTQWTAARSRLDLGEARSYDQLTNRIHQLMYRLASQPDGRYGYLQFLSELDAAQDLNSFMALLNSKYLAANEAPYVAWIMDPAEFSPDKANGGWTSTSPGSAQREAILALRDSSHSLIQELRETKEAQRQDNALVSNMLFALENPDQASTADRKNLDRLQRVLDAAKSRFAAMSPNEIKRATISLQQSFYGQAHAKGVTPAELIILGTMQTMADAPGYSTQYERQFDSLVSVSADDVASNPAAVAFKETDIIAGDGSVVHWNGLSVHSLLRTWKNDPESRAVLRAMIFPSAFERTQSGGMVQKYLTDQSLKSLLDFGTYQEFYKETDSSRWLYLSMLDSFAKQHDVQFASMRLMNDVLFAQTSGATKVLTASDHEKRLERVARGTADILRMVGDIYSSLGEDALRKLQSELRKELHGRTHFKSVLGAYSTTEEAKIALEAEFAAREGLLQQELTQAVAGGDLERAKLLSFYMEQLKRRAKSALDDNALQTFREQLRIDWSASPAEIAQRKQEIRARVVSRGTSFYTKTPWALTAIRRAISPLRMNGNVAVLGHTPVEDRKMWDMLISAITAVHFEDLTSIQADGVAIPDVDQKEAYARRYIDPTYSYLLDFLDPQSPEALAARKMHEVSFGPGHSDATLMDLRRKIEDVFLNEEALAPWTYDIPRVSLEARQRIDSSSAPAAVAIFGMSPRNQFALSVATQETRETATLDLTLSTGVIPMNTLFDEEGSFTTSLNVLNAPPTDIDTPVRLLNGRFAKEARLMHKGVELADLWTQAVPQLGTVLYDRPEVAASDFRAISLRELRAAANSLLPAHVDINEVTVEIKYLHPDSQPAKPEYYNSLFYEGISSGYEDSQIHSLIGAMWFSSGGLSPNGQTTALGANKKGRAAYVLTELFDPQDRNTAESGWLVDFSKMLTNKASLMFSKDIGTGFLDSTLYNAVLKHLKMRHYVRGTINGAAVLWTAEQVIEWQRQNPGASIDTVIENAELWKPSDATLRVLLGDTGDRGPRGVMRTNMEMDPNEIARYRGITDEMLERVTGWDSTTELARTSAGALSMGSRLTVRPALAVEDYARLDDGVQYAHAMREKIMAARRSSWNEGYAQTRIKDVTSSVTNLLRSSTSGLDLSSVFGYIGTPNTDDSMYAIGAILAVASEFDTSPFQTAHVYEEYSGQSSGTATITQVSLDPHDTNYSKPALADTIATGELLWMKLESFTPARDTREQRIELMKKRLTQLSGFSPVIALTHGQGESEMLLEAGLHLETLGYEKVLGNRHLWRPMVRNSKYQTREARLSTLTETHTETGADTQILFLAGEDTSLNTTENSMLWVSRTPNVRMLLPVNLLPINAFGSFGRPQLPEDVDKVRAQVTALLEPGGFDFILKQSGIKDPNSKDARELRKALRDYLDNADETGMPATGTEFGLGSIIPLIDRKGRLLLYRHGKEAPGNLEKMLQAEFVEGDHAYNVGIYSPKNNPNATVYTGTVQGFDTDSVYGLRVWLRLPLQQAGLKLQVEGAGMKYLLVLDPDSRDLPAHDIFGENGGIDGLSDLMSLLSKEALTGLGNNFRNLFATFGIDFTDDLVQFFFQTDPKKLTPAELSNARGSVEAILRSIAREEGGISPVAVEEMLRAMYVDEQVFSLLDRLSIDTSWKSRLNRNDGPTYVSDQIARAAVLYMLLPGAQPYHILRAGGLNNPGARTDGSQTTFMPRIFTEVFDRTPFESPLRREILKRLNAQIDNTKAVGNEAYWLNPDLTLSMHGANGQVRTGFLQLARMFSAGDNPVMNGQAFDRTDDQTLSRHSLDIAYETLGAPTLSKNELTKAKRFASLRDGVTEGSFWEQLTGNLVRTDTPVFMRETPSERARRELAYEAVGAFRKPLDTSQWEEAEVEDYILRRNEVAGLYGLTPDQGETVDFWIRQMAGMPLGEGDRGRISVRLALECLNEIQWNHTNHLLPIAGAEVPQIHLYDLQMLFNASSKDLGTFTLWSGPGTTKEMISWDSWVETALGTGQTEHKVFDPLYLLATDGFMHTFEDALDTLVGLPVSRSVLVQLKLLDPATDRLLQSLDSATDSIGRDPMVLEADRATLANIMGMERIASTYRGHQAPSSMLAKRRAQRIKWRKENGIPMPMDTTMRDFQARGTRFLNEGTTTNSLIRTLTNLRVGNGMANPQLWVGAMFETAFRTMLTDITNLALGQSTNKIGRAATKAANKLGMSVRYSPEDLKHLQITYQNMGSNPRFKSMIYKDLTFRQEKRKDARWLERQSHKYAQFAARLQDPAYGLVQETMARLYTERVLQEVALLDLPISPMQVANHLRTNPLWVQDNMPEIHKAASNVIANTRGLRATPLSLMIKGVVAPMADSKYLAVNMFGGLVRLPLIFSGYLTNVLTNMTGMQGFSALAAMFAQNRSKGFIGRIQSAIKGEPFDPESNYFNMEDALDGVSLVNMFVQGGITHTGLFALGLAAGGLGLSGEDEEERRRRRAAMVSGGQFLYDPRRIQNDFLNSNAIFLDYLPPFISSWFKVTPGEDGRSMAQLPWILRQFVSPIIGMERFFETGDPAQILLGFQDALGSMPLVNASTFDDASQMFTELMANANDSMKLGTPDDMVASYGFLVSAVGTLERMLFENAFINMVYTGLDAYDRDPWKLPLLDSERDQQFDRLGNPRATNALSDFVDPATGEVRSGYETRDWVDGTVHGLAENRFTLALIASLVTGRGLGSDYLRQNMVIRERRIDKNEMTLEEAQGLILSIMDSESYGTSTEILTASGARGVFQSLYTGLIDFDSPVLDSVYIPLDMRQEIFETWQAELVADGLNAGLSMEQAERWMWDVMKGDGDSPAKIGILDILWSHDIPYTSTVRYNQLNTTYMMGPGGQPYATGLSRDLLLGGFGLLPQRYLVTGDPGLPRDNRLNSIDPIAQLNTGMRSLERVDDSWAIPTDEEIAQRLEKSIASLGDRVEDLLNSGYNNGWRNFNNGWRNFGRGWRNFGRRGYSRGGYGGYSSSTYVADYGGQPQRFNPQDRVSAAYSDDLYSINTSNPIIRRANLRRERFSSERGRLNQWQ